MGKKCYFIIMLFVAFLFSCTGDMDVDTSKRSVAVYAILEDTTVQTVKLFYTSSLSGNYTTAVSDAEVYVERLDGEVAIDRYDFYKLEDGVWQGKFKPVSYAVYKLTVAVPGEELITATTRFPIRTEWIRGTPSNGSNADIGTEDFYTRGSSSNYEHLNLCSFMDYIPESKSYRLSTSLCVGDILHMLNRANLLSSDFEYGCPYALIRSKMKFSDEDSISFTDQSRMFKVTIVMDGSRSLWMGANRIGVEARHYYNDSDHSSCIHPLSYMIVQTVSKEYGLYIKDVITKSQILEYGSVPDLTQLWNKDKVYTNIKNGSGIFAAECRYKMMVKDWGMLNRPALWELRDITIPGWND